MDGNTSAASGRITGLLHELRQGNGEAKDRLMSLVYPDLRRLAAKLMRGERPGHTLQATAIVNEAYVKLALSPEQDWRDRAHFFAVAAKVMRRVLVDHARKRQAAKRGGVHERIDFDRVLLATGEDADTVLEIDRALSRLEQVDGRLCRIVELRFFGGLTEEETAEALGISVVTVKRDWALAKAWLYEELSERKRGGRDLM